MALLLGMLVAFSNANAQSTFREDHEGATPAWKPAAADNRYRIDRQTRMQDVARGGRCEQLTITAGNGSFVHFAYPIGEARIIDELRPTLWVRSDRPGIQLLARVVLPRTLDPKTGKAATAVVRGASYTQVGQWQMLAVEQLPQALDRQARVLRAQLGPKVDAREAYVDQVLVNVYAGQGTVNVWLDDLEVAGFVGRRPDQQQADVPIGDAKSSAATNAAEQERRVELQNDVLLVAGKPFFPRIIEYRGEPPRDLARLGFNAIWLRRPPTTDLLYEARRAGLWVVCPPPDPMPARFDSDYDIVLAWNLGHHLAAAELEPATRLAETLRKRDPKRRPLVCQADSQLRGYSRVADILLVDRPVLGTSLELADYVRLIDHRPQLARPGTPIWVAIDLEFQPRVVRQIELLSQRRLRSTMFDIDAIRQAAYIAISAESRGLFFASNGPLPLTETRGAGLASSAVADNDRVISPAAMELTLLNRELALCEPWLTEGQHAAIARDKEGQVSAAVLQSRRGKLVVATRIAPGGQFAAGAHASGNVALVAPGVSETHDALSLSAAGLQGLSHRRMAGGMQFNWDDFGSTACAVLTVDSLLVSNLNRQAMTNLRQTAAFQMALARRSLAEGAAVARDLPSMQTMGLDGRAKARPDRRSPDGPITTAAEALDTAAGLLRQAEQQFAAGDAAAAYRFARRSSDAVALWRRAAWERAVRDLRSPVASPLAITTMTLAEQGTLSDRIGRAVIARNSLVGGDCENLNDMAGSGWKHYEHAGASVTTQVELSAASPFAGESALRLAAASSDPAAAEAFVETPPVWIVTSPVRFASDTVVRLRCRVRVPTPITGSVDGLEIIDSLGGAALAARVGHAPDWQEITLYRHAARDEPITLTFALTGIGEAWIDDVAIEPVALPPTANIRPGPASASMRQDAPR